MLARSFCVSVCTFDIKIMELTKITRTLYFFTYLGINRHSSSIISKPLGSRYTLITSWYSMYTFVQLAQPQNSTSTPAPKRM